MIDAVTRYLYGTDSYGDPLVQICEAVADYEQEYTDLKKRDNSGTVLYHAEKINAEVNGFLRNYLNLTDEDLAGLKDRNPSSLLILLNERLAK